MISYIVSHKDQPVQLITCVTSLLVQNGAKEILIADNSTDPEMIRYVEDTCKLSSCIRRISTAARCSVANERIAPCYTAANVVALEEAKGDWLCFPSSDSYYVPGFAVEMLRTAESEDLELVYSDFLYDPRYNNGLFYQVVSAAPRYRMFDKTCFLVKRNRFKGFPLENAVGDDFLMLKHLLEEGIRHGKAPGVLSVHN